MLAVLWTHRKLVERGQDTLRVWKERGHLPHPNIMLLQMEGVRFKAKALLSILNILLFHT